LRFNGTGAETFALARERPLGSARLEAPQQLSARRIVAGRGAATEQLVLPAVLQDEGDPLHLSVEGNPIRPRIEPADLERPPRRHRSLQLRRDPGGDAVELARGCDAPSRVVRPQEAED